MIGIDLKSSDIAELFIAMMVELGVFVAFALNKPDIIRIEPPLTITTEVVDEVLARIKTALGHVAEVMKQLEE